MADIKIIYEKHYEMQNAKKNIHLQGFAIGLMVITVIIPIIQFIIDKHQRSLDSKEQTIKEKIINENFDCLEKTLTDINDSQNEELNKLLEKYMAEQQKSIEIIIKEINNSKNSK